MTDQSFAEQVFNEIESFFSNGGDGESLLRIACLGSPERTIQGELLTELRKKYFSISEFRYKKQSIDIAIFENSHDATPSILIELKHRSPYQDGGFKSLLRHNHDGDMFDDYQKHRSTLENSPALILIGVSTTIETMNEDLGYPFLSKAQHIPRPNRNINLEQLRCEMKSEIKKWVELDIDDIYPPKNKPFKNFIFIDKCTEKLQHIGKDKQICGSVHAIGFLWL